MIRMTVIIISQSRPVQINVVRRNICFDFKLHDSSILGGVLGAF